MDFKFKNKKTSTFFLSTSLITSKPTLAIILLAFAPTVFADAIYNFTYTNTGPIGFNYLNGTLSYDATTQTLLSADLSIPSQQLNFADVGVLGAYSSSNIWSLSPNDASGKYIPIVTILDVITGNNQLTTGINGEAQINGAAALIYSLDILTNAGNNSASPLYNYVQIAEVYTPAAVPLPAAVWLFSAAITGFIGFNRRKSA